MFLTAPRHEILAESGRGIPYSGKWLYDLSHSRDKQDRIIIRLGCQIAFIGLICLTSIECITRGPFALIASAFSTKRDKWLEGINLCVLTIFYSLYATIANLFVQNLTNHLILFDMNLRFFQKEALLFQACDAGHYELTKYLLENDANPHSIIAANATSALLPHFLGHPRLNSLFNLNDYEKELIDLKLISHWVGLSGEAKLFDEKLRLDSAPSPWLFESLAESLQRFHTCDDFKNIWLTGENAGILQNALFDAYTLKSYELIARKVRDGELTFLASGWEGHAICLSFYKGYMAIGNCGEGSDITSTLDVCKVDPKMLTGQIVEEILMHQHLSKEAGKTYFYKTLPAKLSKSKKIEKDGICRAFTEIAPKPSKLGICSLASKKAALRFAWSLLLCDPPDEEVFERARLETKFFSDWTAVLTLEGEKLSEKLPNVTPRDKIHSQAYDRWLHKVERLQNSQSRIRPWFFNH